MTNHASVQSPVVRRVARRLLPYSVRSTAVGLGLRVAHSWGTNIGGWCRRAPLSLRDRISREMAYALVYSKVSSAFGRRFAQSFVRVATMGLPTPVFVERYLGPSSLRILLDIREKTQQGIAFHPCYEPFVTEKLGLLLTPGSLFIDVGAHVGYFSLLAAQLVGASGRVIAFEPNPANRTLLTRNINLNCLTNVDIYPFALSDYRGAAVLYLNPFNDGGGGLSPFEEFPDGSLRWTRDDVARLFHDQVLDVEVEVWPLDELAKLLPREGRVSAIKIDVEGAELSVLKGMRKIICRDLPSLIVEIAPSNTHSVFDFLTSLGYQNGAMLDSVPNWLFLHPSNGMRVSA